MNLKRIMCNMTVTYITVLQDENHSQNIIRSFLNNMQTALLGSIETEKLRHSHK